MTDSFDDLLASPDGESKLDNVMAAFTPPGGLGYGIVTLEPGEYLAVCPIAQGSTGDTEGTGQPHFVLGMHQVITVTG